jgi:hypothetical protein
MTTTEQFPPSSPVPDEAVENGASALVSLVQGPHPRPVSTADEARALKPIGVAQVISLPIRMDVRVPVPNFRFKDLAALETGQVLRTEWSVAEDLPVATGDVRLLWAEFAVADQRLTVRVTRVA